MKNQIDKIAEYFHIMFPGEMPTEDKMLKLVKEYIKSNPNILLEARDNNYAAYEVKKDKVIAKVSAQKAAAFTALAKSWRELDASVETLETKKRELNELKNKVQAQEEELHVKIKEKVLNIFDDSERAMTLTVECLNSSFTLSKLTEANQDKVLTPKGDIISTDYKKVVELLLAQNADLKDTIDSLIKQSSVIASEDVMKAGAKRRLSVNVGESVNLTEGILDRVFNAITKFRIKIMTLLNRVDGRQNQIDKIIFNLA